VVPHVFVALQQQLKVHVAEALGGAAEGSYEQEAAAVAEDEEMEREDARGVAKWPDLNKLDVPEWAELALNKVECKALQACAKKHWVRWFSDAGSSPRPQLPPSRSRSGSI
jgi:hypothetical protein